MSTAVFEWATTVLTESLYEMLPPSERYLMLHELMEPHKIEVSLQNDRVYFEGSWGHMLEAQESLLQLFSKDCYRGDTALIKEESCDEKMSAGFEDNNLVEVEESNNTLSSKSYDLMSIEYSQPDSRLLEETTDISQESISEKQERVDSLVRRKRTKTKENKMLRGSLLARRSMRNLQQKYKKHRVKLNEMYCEPVEQKETKSLSPLSIADVNEIYVDITLNSQLDDVSTLLESSGILLPLMNEAKLDDETATTFSSHEITGHSLADTNVEANIEEVDLIGKNETKETRQLLKKADEARLKSIAKKQVEDMKPIKYFCTKCSFKSKRSSHLEKHMVYHTVDCELFSCNKCPFIAIRPWILRRHKVDVHDKGVLTCHLCAYCTDKSNLLTIHKRRKHGLAENGEILPIKTNKGRKELHCAESGCAYHTNSGQLMKRHGRRHERQRQLALAREMGGRDFACQQCSYGTWNSARLDRHVTSVHGSARTHLCPVCGAGFKRPDSLAVHVRSHQRPTRSYQCPLCSRTLRHRDTLKTHLSSVHSKVRTHLCATCGAAFKTSANHRKHVVTIHENPRAFPCTQCARKFNTKFTLARHIGKMHRVDDEPIADAAKPEDQPASVQTEQLPVTFAPANTILIQDSLPPGLDARMSIMHPETPSLALLSETDNSYCTANSETAAALLYLGSYTSY